VTALDIGKQQLSKLIRKSGGHDEIEATILMRTFFGGAT
jgi:hypothetical protein